ncbi:hypothetical protein B1748_03060 [Paenibacillus sp. MY03]|uniref:alpha/beta hydrolase family protein n=1 Tax=Paenibacillus sp. MY03 TaxID=302980 RepID=UPI000B3D10F7|nr:CocE/NonD family hydrolase [Paenibacillus sp. MY03]OUS77777.1 hypothetical protein B1748_03060 [Paenibacillus sp. MY03]
MGFGSYASGYYDIGTQLPDYLKRLADNYFARDREVKEGLRDVEIFEPRKAGLKKYFIEMIGGLPESKTPLEAVCTGIADRGSYQIRKMVYQSLPGVYVTANLYVPTAGTGPYPAVLFACGHIEAGKAAPIYQKVCIELVNNGFVVLAVDPISHGERMQGYDAVAGRTIVRWHAEHTYLGLQCELAGRHIVRYFVWDLIRSVDYLCTVEEVDSTRIGITGNSGGGIQSIMAMIADDRIAAAAPCTYISSREAYMKTGQPQDGEQVWDGAIRAGMDYDDYITLFAPKPVLIGAVESDFFCIEGTLDSYDWAKRVYALYGREDDVELGLAKGTHAFNDELRGIVVSWFVKRFLGQGQSVLLSEGMIPESTDTLQCTLTGQVLQEYKDAVSVQADNAASVLELRRGLRELARDSRRMREEVAAWLRMPECGDPIRPRIISTERVDREGCLMERAFLRESTLFFSEPNMMVGGIMIEREGSTCDRTTVLLLDKGTDGIYTENDWITSLTAESRVFAFDPRGTGAFLSRAVNGRQYDMMFGTEYKLGCDARMLDRPLAGMRVFDALRALDYAAQRDPGTKLGIAGQGYGAIYALLAGIVDDRVDEICLENLPGSFADMVETRFYPYDVRNHWYGVLRHFDLPELIEAFRETKRIRIVDMPDVGRIVKF